MNKRLLIITGVLVILLTGIVFLQVWGIKNKKEAVDDVKNGATQEVPAEVQNSAPANVPETGAVSNEEINSLETDLNSIDDENFSENSISDTEVGL